MPTVANVLRHLQGYQSEEHIACAIWCEEDVLGRAEERGIKITREQVQNILDTIDRKQDCSLGISWDTIDVFTDEELAG
jgi:hypothetical protein